MPQTEDEPLQRIHIYMYERDIDTIKAIIGNRSDQSKFIRKIVRNYLDRMRQKAEEKREENNSK